MIALAGLMLLAFAPLFFAVASLTRATIFDAREESARALGRAIAVHVADARALGDEGAVERALRGHSGPGGVETICVFGRDGTPIDCEGAPPDVQSMRPPAADVPESARVVHGPSGRRIEVVSKSGDAVVVARVRVDADADRGTPLVRLVALYMIVFALALLMFAYFALTRLIVRPVDKLVAAADRVASGARTLQVPTNGARELAELSASVQAMAEKLISEEAALIMKVDELTETTVRLTQTQAQLVRSERMASVGRLAAGLAHEIGNPIAALMGIEDLILDGDMPREQERDFIQRMRRETVRIHSVVRDLLDFARPEEASRPGGGTPVTANVAAVLDDVVSLVRPQKAFRTIDVATDADRSIDVALSAPRLTQVLLNMVLNAGAAIESARRERGRVGVRAVAVDGKRVRIEVEDDGPGIAPTVRDRLFEPFVTTKEVGEGTGLGLAVCRGLVESAGGEIGIDYSYAGGARFYVVLPVASP